MELKQKVLFYLIPFLATIILTRIYLYIFPFTNLDLGQYNIHHLFLGSFLLVITTILFIFEINLSYILALSGISSALIVDELTYLIATDGSDLAYLTPVSLVGAIILTTLIVTLVGGLYYVKQKRN